MLSMALAAQRLANNLIRRGSRPTVSAATSPLRWRTYATSPSGWRWDYRLKDGKWTKPPINPRTGRLASVSDPATWVTFDDALAGMERHGLAGVGLVLTEDGGITGVDLDDCMSDAGSSRNSPPRSSATPKPMPR